MSGFKLDMHVHTAETSRCGKVRAEQMVELYKEAGYNGVVITDHYKRGFFDNIESLGWEEQIKRYLTGYSTAFNRGRELGLKVFLGIELTFEESPNDFLVYGITPEFLINNPRLFTLTLKDFKTLVNDNDILVYQAHPFRPGLNPVNPSLIDGIEVYNGNPRHDSYNDLAYQFAINNELKLISGSDFHQIEDVARGGIIIDGEINNERELVNFLKNTPSPELIRSV
ncbi:PHP domain-containing protein [Halothermothrix orenii]|uniref:PHP domain protein n=1 Tax=Halothermothrix orenii (strain H 168 / OCM 544 / DSM 9562) TaxID=373903 RepID=B8CZN1_HALOH|nr:PHP domain-containing protein [Halothermothrix orenii]ACL70750.1 PHP domain protein [Halothermothrix orenii H 168]